MTRIRRPSLLTIAACLLLARPGLAQAPPAGAAGESELTEDQRAARRRQEEATTARLQISAAAEPSPALRHSFVESRVRLRPGNAALSYYRALRRLAALGSDPIELHMEREQAWHASPLDEATRQEIRDWLQRHQQVLDAVREGAQLQDCDWGPRFTEAKPIAEFFATMLDEFQELRAIIRVLRVEAHLACEEGRYDDAIESIRTGYRLSIDTAQAPLLICGLIGAAGVSVMNESVEDLLSRPDAPNLYWALGTIPDPPADLRPAVDNELKVIINGFEVLRDPLKKQLSADEWQRLAVRDVRQFLILAEGVGPQRRPTWQLEAGLCALALRAYPLAKQELLKRGFDQRQLSEMPVAQVVAAYQARLQQEVADDMLKAFTLPPRLAARMLEQTEERQRSAVNKEAAPVITMLMPAISAVYRAQLRMQRSVHALRNVEALRAHLAAHGELPESLDMLDPLPALEEVLSGQPMQYRRVEGGAELILPPVGPDDPYSGRKYLLRIRKQTR